MQVARDKDEELALKMLAASLDDCGVEIEYSDGLMRTLQIQLDRIPSMDYAKVILEGIRTAMK